MLLRTNLRLSTSGSPTLDSRRRRGLVAAFACICRGLPTLFVFLFSSSPPSKPSKLLSPSPSHAVLAGPSFLFLLFLFLLVAGFYRATGLLCKGSPHRVVYLYISAQPERRYIPDLTHFPCRHSTCPGPYPLAASGAAVGLVGFSRVGAEAATG